MIDGDIYRHKKRGTTYIVLTREAIWEPDVSPAVVYQCLDTGRVWVRPRREFLDGRFEPVDPSPTTGRAER